MKKLIIGGNSMKKLIIGVILSLFCVGNVGAIIVGLLVPFLLDISNWALVFLSWSTCCLMIILLVMFLYVDAQVDGKKAKERDILNLKEAIE